MIIAGRTCLACIPHTSSSKSHTRVQVLSSQVFFTISIRLDTQVRVREKRPKTCSMSWWKSPVSSIPSIPRKTMAPTYIEKKKIRATARNRTGDLRPWRDSSTLYHHQHPTVLTASRMNRLHKLNDSKTQVPIKHTHTHTNALRIAHKHAKSTSVWKKEILTNFTPIRTELGLRTVRNVTGLVTVPFDEIWSETLLSDWTSARTLNARRKTTGWHLEKRDSTSYGF